MPNCSRNDTVCVLLLLLQHIQEAERDFMAFKELPHVAASRIALCVRCPGWLAHLSPGEWLRCLLASRTLCKFSIQTTQKATQFPLIGGGAGAGAETGAEACAFEDHTKC